MFGDENSGDDVVMAFDFIALETFFLLIHKILDTQLREMLKAYKYASLLSCACVLCLLKCNKIHLC